MPLIKPLPCPHCRVMLSDCVYGQKTTEVLPSLCLCTNCFQQVHIDWNTEAGFNFSQVREPSPEEWAEDFQQNAEVTALERLYRRKMNCKLHAEYFRARGRAAAREDEKSSDTSEENEEGQTNG